LVLAIIYVPLFQGLVGTAPFPLRNWLWLFACTPLLVLVDEVRKAIARRRLPCAWTSPQRGDMIQASKGGGRRS